jgi:hypothetical protein
MKTILFFPDGILLEMVVVNDTPSVKRYLIDTIMYRPSAIEKWCIAVQDTFPVWEKSWEAMELSDVPKTYQVTALILT